MFALIVPLLYASCHICSAVPQYNPIWDNLYRFQTKIFLLNEWLSGKNFKVLKLLMFKMIPGSWHKHKRPFKTLQTAEEYQRPAPGNWVKTNAFQSAHGRKTPSSKLSLKETSITMGHIGLSAVSLTQTPSPNCMIHPWYQKTSIAWPAASRSTWKTQTQIWRKSNANAVRLEWTARYQPTWKKGFSLWNPTSRW